MTSISLYVSLVLIRTCQRERSVSVLLRGTAEVLIKNQMLQSSTYLRTSDTSTINYTQHKQCLTAKKKKKSRHLLNSSHHQKHDQMQLIRNKNEIVHNKISNEK
jgi:hypothetical protein